MSKKLLLIFVRSAEEGKVKTRLAQSLGTKKALDIYERLLEITHHAVLEVDATKWVCYAEAPPTEADIWNKGNFEKKEQPQDPDLGFRMHQLFAQGLIEGFSHVVIIGSDCPDMSKATIEKAFETLETHDVVVGPAIDGGYYLLGLNFLVPELFTAIPWSTDKVLSDSLQAAESLDLKVAQLPALSDLDVAEDLAQWPHLF